MSKDIFDLENTQDLPKEILKNIEQSRLKIFSKESIAILALFELKKELTLAEVMVGLYRKFKLIVDKKKIYQRLHHLTFKKLLIREAEIYKLNK